jgi:hypothetical protein
VPQGFDERSRIHARHRYLLPSARSPRVESRRDTRINTVTLIDGPRVAATTEG